MNASIYVLASIMSFSVGPAAATTPSAPGRGCGGDLASPMATENGGWIALSAAAKADYLGSAAEYETGVVTRAPVESWSTSQVLHHPGQTATYTGSSVEEVLANVPAGHYALVSDFLSTARQNKTFRGRDVKVLVRKNDRLPRSRDPSNTYVTVSLYLDVDGGLMGASLLWKVPDFFQSAFVDQDRQPIFRQPPHQWHWLQDMFT